MAFLWLGEVQSWVSVLEASGIIFFLRPYENNILKRVIKIPKVYFNDVGLVCYLVGWDNKAVAQNGAMAGTLFETFVVSEIVKSWINKGLDVRNIFFYRDSNKKEIDLLIKRNATIFPIEIKMTATPHCLHGQVFPSLERNGQHGDWNHSVPVREKCLHKQHRASLANRNDIKKPLGGVFLPRLFSVPIQKS